MLPALAAMGQTPSAAEDLHQRVEQLQQLRLERLAAQRAFEQQSASLDQQVAKLAQEQAALTATVQPLRQAVDDARRNIQQQSDSAASAREQFKAAADAAAGTAAIMQQRIAAGIPYHREERSEKFARIAAALRGEDLAAAAAALGDFWSSVAEELRLANTTQLWNEPLKLEGNTQQLHAYRLRLGLANELFISEDGRVTGLASHRPDRAWTLLTDGEAVRQLFGVARQQKAVEITRVPFSPPASPAASSGGGAR